MIQKQQHTLLSRRPSIPSENEVEKDAAADEPCQFEDRADYDGHDKGDADDAREVVDEPRGR